MPELFNKPHRADPVASKIAFNWLLKLRWGAVVCQLLLIAAVSLLFECLILNLRLPVRFDDCARPLVELLLIICLCCLLSGSHPTGPGIHVLFNTSYELVWMYFRFRDMAKALRPMRRKPMMIRPNALARLSRKK